MNKNVAVVMAWLLLFLIGWAICWVASALIETHRRVVVMEVVFAEVIGKDFIPQHEETQELWMGEWSCPHTVTIPDRWKITLSYGRPKVYFVSKNMYDQVELGDHIEINISRDVKDGSFFIGEITNKIE